MTNWIKQENNWSCLACCVCMATNTPLNDFYDYIGHDGSDVVQDSDHPDGRRGFTMVEATKYMLRCGILSSFIQDNTAFSVKLPAIVIVKSDAHIKGGTHSMYWDGESLFCPRNGKIGTKFVKNKNIVMVMPLFNLKELE